MNRSPWKKITAQDNPPIQPWALPLTSRSWYSITSRLAALADGFDPITLDEMDAVALLNRTDTKFVFSSNQLLNVLATLQKDYYILSVDGQRLNHYRTLYFDTPNFDLYNLHVNKRADRFKVRSREYIDSSLSFLEVKHRTNKGRTMKERLLTEYPLEKITPEAKEWLAGVFPFDSRVLESRIWNTFTRITLVSKHCCERVTLDVDLAFYTSEKSIHLDGIAIAEAKMPVHQSSYFLTQMHNQHIHPQSFSKYCIGVSMLYTQVKKNALKPKLLWLGKMTGGLGYYG